MPEDREEERATRRRDPEDARELIESLYGKASSRRDALELMANAIEMAHRAQPDAWRMSFRQRDIPLMMGRFWACALSADSVGVAVVPSAMRPGAQAAMEAAGAERRAEPQFRLLPEVVVYDVPAGALASLRSHLNDGLRGFLESAAKLSKVVSQGDAHAPGVLRYFEAELQRTLPRPSHAPSDEGVLELAPRREVPKAKALVHPRVQFTERRYDVDGLLNYIAHGDIALPEIQRPFVWTPTKVRELFDSMYRGFPVGSLMLWVTPDATSTKAIGLGEKQRPASLLVVDGQQRLTSLYAVLLGKTVVDDDFKDVRIEIAFRPRDGTFEVADAINRKDPEFLPNISELWTSNKPSRRLINEFVDRLRAKRDLTPEDEDAISHNLDRLFDLTKYPFSAIEIAKDVDEEAVADIFVRINNGGTKLGQSAFILTLLSVFSPATRKLLEDFARRASAPPTNNDASPFNHLIRPGPDQLVRVVVALGFHRARLSAVYQLLRGKDVDTGIFSQDRRPEQFRRMEEATGKVLDLNHWHGFLTCLVGAGFRSADLISSESALLNSYALYLIGRLQCSVDPKTLGRLMAQWFFAASLSGRYSGSAEGRMEEDLSRVRDVRDAATFVAVLEQMMAGVLTNDFWEITLPLDLDTSSANSPAARAYLAAQIKLGAPVLFSDRRIADLYDPSLRTQRKTIETHHLFPKNWLKKQGLVETKVVNQVANFAFVEWPDNAAVSDSAPTEYVPKLRELFSAEAFDTMCRAHALPTGWEAMTYDTFLRERRVLMSRIIRRGFEALGSHENTAIEPPRFAAADEKRAWALIEELELGLRSLVRSRAEAKWAAAAESRIMKLLSEQEQADIERNKAKHLAGYPLSQARPETHLLDYFYLGQLITLLLSNDLWVDVKPLFKEKDQLQRTVASISKVRNDRAHFRAVPEKELQRCVLACDDLLTVIRSQAVVPAGVAG
jgi:hypothetical protein